MRPILPAMLSCSGLKLTDEEKYFFSRINPLGINLFGRNINNKTQLQKLVDEIKNVINREDVFLALDQEGGRVQRLTAPEYPNYAAAITLGKLPLNQAKRAAEIHAALIAHDLNEIGLNLNYAPVLDLCYPNTTEALRSRCFSADEQTVAVLGRCETDTYMANGIVPCIKHIPGHGRAQTDPHLGLPRIAAPLNQLQNDFYPFRQLRDCPLAMTAHIVISAVDDKNPVTHSRKVIRQIIRQQIGFDNLLLSDAIDMKALQGSAGDKAARAISAGCDAICYALGDMAEMQDIAANLPPMSDKSLERFAKTAKIIHNTNKQQNWLALTAEYNLLIGDIPPYQETYDATEVLNHLLPQQKQEGDKPC